MVLLAAFKSLLQRYTGENDIVVGSPIANRSRAELEPLIGFFVNMLVMRTDVSGNPDFMEVLRRVRETALGACDHQDLPFEKLVEALRPERDVCRNPLFEVSFAVQNAPRVALALPKLTATPQDPDTHATRFDLELHVLEEEGRLSCVFLHRADRFSGTTMRRLLAHWRTLLEGVVEEPGRPISDLALLSHAERQQVLEEWNDTVESALLETCFHRLFESQAERTPDAVAVGFSERGSQWTYR